MNTWAAHAALAHATLTSGLGPAPAFGSVSLYSFALGASAAVLAMVVVWSPKRLSLRSRSESLARNTIRPGRVRRRTARTSSASEPDDTVIDSIADAEPAIADPAVDDGEAPRALDQVGARRTSRLRQRIDLMLLQMLGDDNDQPLAPSNQQLAEPAKQTKPAKKIEPAKQTQNRKHAPRHAAQRAKG